MDYKKAPISEVIIGVSYKTRKFSDIELININNYLNNDYPIFEIVPTLPDEILDNNILSPKMDLNVTGPVLYRRKSKDNSYLIQIQGNKIYMNWLRLDGDSVGNYPGFSELLNKFTTLISEIKKIINKEMFANVEYFDLTYQDRFLVDEIMKDFPKTNQYINMNLIPDFISDAITGLNYNFLYKTKELNGYGIFTTNNNANFQNKQVFMIQSILRGKAETDTFDNWIQKAHAKQISLFEKFFTDELKQKWK